MLSAKLRLTGVTNLFHDFLIDFFKVISIAIIFLQVTFYLFCLYTLYIDIRILIDFATVTITIFNDSTTAWLTSRCALVMKRIK